jgi:anti-sigma-K factor RskA
VNTKEYISSGIIESYVLGLVTQEEAEEFEKMCTAYSEIKIARDVFEQQLERNAIAVGIQPPRKIKSLVLSEIEIDAEKSHWQMRVATPQQVVAPTAIQLNPTFWKYLVAASVILLIGSSVLNFFFFSQYRKYNNQYSQLLDSQAVLTNTVKGMQMKEASYAAAMKMANDSNMAMIKMSGVAKHPGMLATVFWNKQTKNVYVMPENLPAPPAGKQYQLWAFVGGKPIDAGLLNWENGNMLSPMKTIASAEAFAITLEGQGGSSLPTNEEMYVLGHT